MTESPLISADVPCSACGYNLRTLGRDARCPECGQAVRISLSASSVEAQEYKTLRSGSAWLLTGAAIGAALPWIVVVMRSVSTSFGMPRTREALMLDMPFGWAFLAQGCCCFAAFILTRRDRERERSELFFGLGRAVRILTVAALCWPILHRFVLASFLRRLPLAGLDPTWPLVAFATFGLFICMGWRAMYIERALAVQFGLLAVLLPTLELINCFASADWISLRVENDALLAPLVGVGVPQLFRPAQDVIPRWFYEFSLPSVMIVLSAYAILLVLLLLLFGRARKVSS
jgi:hypothetical protein